MDSSTDKNPIPPWNRIAVNAKTAAQMLGIARSTFFKRVAAGELPKPGPGGLWSVTALRRTYDADEPATA